MFWKLSGMGNEGAEDAPVTSLWMAESSTAGQECLEIPGTPLWTRAGDGDSVQPQNEGWSGALRVQSTFGFSALTQGIPPEQCQELWGPALYGDNCMGNVRAGSAGQMSGLGRKSLTSSLPSE